MEKNFNTDSDSMDLLLKQAFLKLDENQLSNQKLNDMLATTVLNNNEIIQVNSAKEKELFKKISHGGNTGFWAANKLWISLSGLALCGALIFTYFYFTNPATPLKVATALTTNKNEMNDPTQESNLIPILRDSVMPEKADHSVSDASTFTKTPASQNVKDVSIPVASPPQLDPPAINYATPSIEPNNKTSIDFDNLPILTEDDKKKNKKRKEAMIKYVLKAKPTEWIKINPDVPGLTPEYYMNAVEITNIQYKTFLMDLIEQNRVEDYKLARVKNSLWKEIGISGFENLYFFNNKYDNNAVVNVKPEGMRMYAEWLNDLVNNSKQKKSEVKYKMRLPSEAEWKFACTSSTIPDPIYTSGLNMLINSRNCMLANYKPLPQNGEKVSNPNYLCDDSTKFVTGSSKYCTTLTDSTLFYPVMVYAFNPSYRGFYCMAGNVSEVVTNANGTYRTIGGNWNSTATYLKMNAPDEFEGKSLQNPFVGFRILFVKKIMIPF